MAPLELYHQKQVSDPVVGIRRLIIGIGIIHSRSVVEIHRQSVGVSHLEKNCNKSWVYQLMSIHPERQSIYTLVVPPVQGAEEARRRLKKRKRGHVAWINNNGHFDNGHFNGQIIFGKCT